MKSADQIILNVRFPVKQFCFFVSREDLLKKMINTQFLRVMDTIIPSKQWFLLLRTSGWILFLYTGNSILSMLTRFMALNLVQPAIEKFRHDLLTRLLIQPHVSHTTKESGDIHTMIVQEA